MSKAVMISIRPKWCAKIIIGRKTMELRKSVPKLEVPFKCYIYCTSGHPHISVKGGNLDRDTVRTNTVGRCNGKVMCGREIDYEVDGVNLDYNHYGVVNFKKPFSAEKQLCLTCAARVCNFVESGAREEEAEHA